MLDFLVSTDFSKRIPKQKFYENLDVTPAMRRVFVEKIKTVYYHTPWMPQEALHFTVDGLDMDAVYENLVRQIAGDELQADSGESLKQSVERDEKKKLLEKQLNRQMEMNVQLKRLRRELEGII